MTGGEFKGDGRPLLAPFAQFYVVVGMRDLGSSLRAHMGVRTADSCVLCILLLSGIVKLSPDP